MIEYTRYTIIGEQCPRYKVEFWTALSEKVGGPEHQITYRSHYFHNLTAAQDWFRENYQRFKDRDITHVWWTEIEMRWWDLTEQ